MFLAMEKSDIVQVDCYYGEELVFLNRSKPEMGCMLRLCFAVK